MSIYPFEYIKEASTTPYRVRTVRPTEDKSGPTPVTVGGEGIGTSVALVIVLGVR